MISLSKRLALLFCFAAACGTPNDRTEEPIVIDDGTATGDETGEPPPEDEAPATDLAVGEDPCESDADCMPAACCHPAACVARGNAPSCADTMCTMECRYGTMDCGGGCVCHEGRCAARLTRDPQPSVQ